MTTRDLTPPGAGYPAPDGEQVPPVDTAAYPAWGDQWLAAYRVSGTVGAACAMLKPKRISRMTFYRAKKGCAAFREAVEAITEDIADDYEALLRTMAYEKNFKAIALMLRSLRPDRFGPRIPQAFGLVEPLTYEKLREQLFAKFEGRDLAEMAPELLIDEEGALDADFT